MQMDEGMDTGPIYIRSALTILEDETSATLHDKLAEKSADLIRKHLDDIVAGKVAAVPQDETQATYAPLIKKSDGEIDWESDGLHISRQIRAMTPWPGAYTSWKGNLLKVLSAAPVAIGRARSRKPGEVFIFERKISVAAGSDGVLLKVVQLSGKPSMSVEEFVRGRSDFIGSHLGD
jgi:methionyl-tRNA formyltransferase